MRILLTATLAIASTAVSAADPPPFDYWSAAAIAAHAQALAPAVDAAGVAFTDPIVQRDGYFAGVVHREHGPGFAEAHRDWSDVYFVTQGSATLLAGGSIADATESTPGEPRGTVIEGATRQRIAAGDVVHIPPGVPHNVLVGEGERISYFILKLQRR